MQKVFDTLQWAKANWAELELPFSRCGVIRIFLVAVSDVDGQGMHKWYSQGATSQLKMNPGQKSQVEVGNWTTKLWMMRRDVLGVLHLDNHLIGVSVRPENRWDDEMLIFAAKDGCRYDTLPLWSFSSAWFLQCAGHGEPHGWDCAMPSHYLSQLQHAGLLNAGLVWLVGKERCPSWSSPKWRTRLLQYHRRLTPSETPPWERANIRNTSTHSIYLPSWPLIIPADTCLCQAIWRCCLLHLDNASIKSLQYDNHIISTYILYKI